MTIGDVKLTVSLGVIQHAVNAHYLAQNLVKTPYGAMSQQPSITHSVSFVHSI